MLANWQFLTAVLSLHVLFIFDIMWNVYIIIIIIIIITAKLELWLRILTSLVFNFRAKMIL
jgi:hypothetical protein